MKILDLGIKVQIEGQVRASDGLEVVDLGEDIDCRVW